VSSVPETTSRAHLNLTELGRIERPPHEAFTRLFVRRSQPIIITAALEHWPARRRWSPEWFRERYGDRRITPYAMHAGHILLHPIRGFVLSPMTVRDYVDGFHAGARPRAYLRTPLDGQIPELVEDTAVPSYCERGQLLRANLWFAGPGTVSRMHIDVPENLMCQVHGRKRYLLFPWSERHRFYRHSVLSPQRFISPVDPERPDLERYPRLAGATGYECVLEAGEMLFIPSGWWHYAEAPETSISVNYWWAEGATWPLLALSALYSRVKRQLGVDV
jgi:hypothetical protein